MRVHDRHLKRDRPLCMKRVVAAAQAAHRLAHEGAVHQAGDELLLHDLCVWPRITQLELHLLRTDDRPVSFNGNSLSATLAITTTHKPDPENLLRPWERVLHAHIVAHAAARSMLVVVLRREEVEMPTIEGNLPLLLKDHRAGDILMSALLQRCEIYIFRHREVRGGRALSADSLRPRRVHGLQRARDNDSLQDGGHDARSVEDGVREEDALAVGDAEHAPLEDLRCDEAGPFEVHNVLPLLEADKLRQHHQALHRKLLAPRLVPTPLA
mmetsp:Transcript_86124/g.184493  ORF Transcript_86124/g.184493 Transcript_86124/m.184493 type:complete len:269 (-) Transcript_86124:1492-2298(-)